MRFALDAHAIGQHLTGNEVYVRSLLEQFATLGQGHEFIAYAGAAATPPETRRVRWRPVASNPWARLGWDLSRQVRRDRPALLHVQYTAPLACPVPVVAIVHDVSYLEHPEWFPPARAWQLRLTVRATIRRARRIIAPSEFSRRRILQHYPELSDDQVVAIPNAGSPLFRPLPRDAAQRAVRERYGLARPYVIAVGDQQPRKNHAGLIRAFADLVRARPDLPHDLVIVGQETWYGVAVRDAARASGVADRIRFTGYVADEHLRELYNAAEVSVFPSFYEGFGLPVLEAMACGRAVACANTSSLPEVADSCALLFDPHRPAEIATALRDLLVDAELRARMERLGLQRSRLFDWARTARATLQLYEEVAGPARRARSLAGSVLR